MTEHGKPPYLSKIFCLSFIYPENSPLQIFFLLPLLERHFSYSSIVFVLSSGMHPALNTK